MYPAVATGALNPADGMVAAVIPTTQYDPSSMGALPPAPLPQAPLPPALMPPANDAAFDSVEALTDQILTAVARSQKLGHRGTRITLTRPTETVEGVRNRLLMAGLVPVVRASSVGGQSVLSLRC